LSGFSPGSTFSFYAGAKAHCIYGISARLKPCSFTLSPTVFNKFDQSNRKGNQDPSFLLRVSWLKGQDYNAGARSARDDKEKVNYMSRILLLLLLVAVPCLAQTSTPPQKPANVRQAKLEAMKKFERLLGKWSGSGTYYGNDGEREFVQTESVESKLEGLVYIVEGSGMTLTGINVHQAFATISYDPEAKVYRFRTHTLEGAGADTFITPTDTGFTWEVAGGKVRYTATVTPDEWSETGERALGATWKKFIEFKLKRIGSTNKADEARKGQTPR
jgi:hypothetical protein